jgi:integrase/recombinase XerC
MTEDADDFSVITTPLVRKWLMAEMSGDFRKDSRGRRLCATSGRRKLSSVKSFFRFLVKEGNLEVNPAVTVNSPKIAQKLPIFLEEDQMEELLDERMAMKRGFPALRDRLILLMLYTTGIRRSEIVGLKISDMDFGRRIIRLCGKGNKQREVPMIAELIADAEYYLEMRKKIVVCNHEQFFVTDKGIPVSADFVYRRTLKCLHEVTLAKRSPHILRHTCASHLLHNGASIQGISELLGHSSLAATQIYTHNSVKSMLNIFKQAHPRA